MRKRAAFCLDLGAVEMRGGQLRVRGAVEGAGDEELLPPGSSVNSTPTDTQSSTPEAPSQIEST